MNALGDSCLGWLLIVLAWLH